MNKMLIKVCGLCHEENIRQVAALGVDWIGMIFWSHSPRCVTQSPEQLALDQPDITSTTKRVGVFVDASTDTIIDHSQRYQLDAVQLHGHESPDQLRQLRSQLDSVLLLKAIGVSGPEDLDAYHPYENVTDYFLFDTKCPSAGGSGQHFDWSVLNAYDGEKPFLLSGGIGPDDAERVLSFHHPKCIGIDLNSRFEIEPGLKNIDALRSFLTQLHQ